MRVLTTAQANQVLEVLNLMSHSKCALAFMSGNAKIQASLEDGVVLIKRTYDHEQWERFKGGLTEFAKAYRLEVQTEPGPM